MGHADDLSDDFFNGAFDVADGLGCDVLDLLGVMMNESQVRPNLMNHTSHAIGLIQFLPSTLVGLGWHNGPNAFGQLSAEAQLPFVTKYFQPYIHFGLTTAARVYQAVFLPATLKLGSSPDTVLIQQGGVFSASYAGNKGLDSNRDGKITVGELQQAIERHFNEPRWQDIVLRVNNLADSSSVAGNAGGSQDQGGNGQDQPIDLQTNDGVVAALSALGFDASPDRLNTSIRAFQQQQRLSPDGVVGPKTRNALGSALDAAGIAFHS